MFANHSPRRRLARAVMAIVGVALAVPACAGAVDEPPLESERRLADESKTTSRHAADAGEEDAAFRWAPQMLDAAAPMADDAADAGTPAAPPALPEISSVTLIGGIDGEYCAPTTTKVRRLADGTLDFEFTDFLFEASRPISIGNASCLAVVQFKDFPVGYTFAIESATVAGNGTPGAQAEVMLESGRLAAVKSMSEPRPVTVGEDGTFSYEERGFATSGSGTCPLYRELELKVRVNTNLAREGKPERFNIAKISRIKLTPRRCTPA